MNLIRKEEGVNRLLFLTKSARKTLPPEYPADFESEQFYSILVK